MTAKIGERAYYLDGVECTRDAYERRATEATNRVYTAAHDRARHPAPELPEDPEIACIAIISALAAAAGASPSMADWIERSFTNALANVRKIAETAMPPPEEG